MEDIMYDPAMDGIDHINVYSKGRTQLGRLLSNFAETPFWGGEHHFYSVEAWWYWFTTGKQHDQLKRLSGFAAKKAGRKFNRVKFVTPALLKSVYSAKLEFNTELAEMLADNELPFAHYYVYGGKPVGNRHAWTAELWSEL
jgi:hypothetical protein